MRIPWELPIFTIRALTVVLQKGICDHIVITLGLDVKKNLESIQNANAADHLPAVQPNEPSLRLTKNPRASSGQVHPPWAKS